ncbi:MAG: flagellar assembly peptidoglycan hydrolase FlgJ [Gammaproteobacteria bacterium]
MTSSVADASLIANSPSVYTDLSGLSALKREAQTQSPEAVRKVAQQFESVFAKMVLSSMRQASSSFGDQLFGSDQQQFYQGMFDDQLSVELTKGKGLGLADMLVQQLTRSGLVKGGDAAKGDASGAADAAGKKDASFIGASTGADMKRDFLINAARGAQRAFPTTPSAPVQGNGESSEKPVSSTLLGTTSESALDATTHFIDKMLAGNAEANASKQWQAGSPEEFVQQLWPCAQEAGKALGVDPKHLLAQAALETGWGKSLPCDTDGTTSFNFFGIKAGDSWQGDSVSVKTLEFEGGVPVPRQAKFRSYDSAADSFRDYVDVLRNNPRYADALNTGSDAKAFAHGLQRGGYATDPRYAMKIEAIAQNLGARAPISETALKSSTTAPMTQPMDLF